jgi:CubicO group peptidase (beta-lactamase class C family)
MMLAGCGPARDVSFAPPDLRDGWGVSTPGAQGMDSATLARGFEHVARSRDFRNATSLLVVRNGVLVAEGYFGGARLDTRHDTRSVTKSVTSLVLGIAIADGTIRDVRQPLSDFYPEHLGSGADERKRAITLEDLLTMRSGLRWNEHAHDDRDPAGMQRSMNSIPYVLHFPASEMPGRVFRYSTGNSQLLSGAVRRGTGKTPFELARERIFGPLGITGAQWATHADGNSYGGMRLRLTARDMAKLGQLCLQNGAWNGRQLVPAQWIAASTRPHSVSAYGPYGYHWWVRPEGYAAQGFGGQYIYVVPDRRLVIVLTADPNAGHHVGFEPMERLIAGYIAGAIRHTVLGQSVPPDHPATSP